MPLCEQAAGLSLLLCFFNLIPVPPLDGSHVLRVVTNMSFRGLRPVCQLRLHHRHRPAPNPGVQRFLVRCHLWHPDADQPALWRVVNLLEIKDLRMDFGTGPAAARAIDGVSLSVGGGRNLVPGGRKWLRQKRHRPVHRSAGAFTTGALRWGRNSSEWPRHPENVRRSNCAMSAAGW